MTQKPPHTEWFADTGQPLKTIDGKVVHVWEFRHQPDEEALSAWAVHFRNHYCLDGEIDHLLRGPSDSRADYLKDIKFPDPKVGLGPSIRAGDFAEILVADYLEYLAGYWVPRTRYDRKDIRNESTKGCDVIGFHFAREGKFSVQDTLAILETKTRFSNREKCKPLLQEAIKSSTKDPTRKAESLNAIKQRLLHRQAYEGVKKVARFQNEEDYPHKLSYGAVALFDIQFFNATLESLSDSSGHPSQEPLCLIVIKGKEMMELVHELYRRAADEA